MLYEINWLPENFYREVVWPSTLTIQEIERLEEENDCLERQIQVRRRMIRRNNRRIRLLKSFAVQREPIIEPRKVDVYA